MWCGSRPTVLRWRHPLRRSSLFSGSHRRTDGRPDRPSRGGDGAGSYAGGGRAYEQLREVPQLRDWAEWQLAPRQVVWSRRRPGDSLRRFNDIPTRRSRTERYSSAMIVASQSEALPTPARASASRLRSSGPCASCAASLVADARPATGLRRGAAAVASRGPLQPRRRKRWQVGRAQCERATGAGDVRRDHARAGPRADGHWRNRTDAPQSGTARQPGIAEMEWRGDSSAAVRCGSGRHRTGAEGSALPSVP